MNNKQFDTLWVNASLATMQDGKPYGWIESGAVGVKDGIIAWIGDMRDAPPLSSASEVHDAAGRCMTPGFIDCHTHLVYAGDRSAEFEMRLQGKSYEDIARAGGGIRSTVKATRAATPAELLQQSLQRARMLLASGVTTLEIKSGYGLDSETELKILRVAKQLEKELPITVKTTFLGAHALPEEFEGRPDDYIDVVCNEMLPRVAKEKLADAVDVFCEKIGFSLAQTERVFAAAQKWNLSIHCHAEQLSDSGSAALAAKYHALSADHLEYLSESSIHAMKQSGTVAVLLPGAFYFLRETRLPPMELLRTHHIPIAIATDCNPGTSPALSLSMMLNMACTLFRMTPEDALKGVTRHAAKALGLEKTHGELSVGKAADMVVWNVKHPAELCYYIGGNWCHEIVKKGVLLR